MVLENTKAVSVTSAEALPLLLSTPRTVAAGRNVACRDRLLAIDASGKRIWNFATAVCAAAGEEHAIAAATTNVDATTGSFFTMLSPLPRPRNGHSQPTPGKVRRKDGSPACAVRCRGGNGNAKRVLAGAMPLLPDEQTCRFLVTSTAIRHPTR